MRTVFYGTPTSAVPSLQALVGASEVAAVVTRPDAPRGRSGRPEPSPVARFAQDSGLLVHRPGDRHELAEMLRTVGRFDVGVVVAFGMILRADVLEVPDHGHVNVHFSVLPRWRGAAPVQRSILAGDGRTGVTLMQMDEGLDTGPIISTWSTVIGRTEDAAALTARLAEGGAGLLGRTLADYANGRVAATPQDDDQASYAHKISSEERWIGPERTVDDAVRTVRGLVPWPGAWIRHDSGPIRIHEARSTDASPRPGTVEIDESGVICGFADGGVRVMRVQPAGKQAMNARDWVRGLQNGPGGFA